MDDFPPFTDFWQLDNACKKCHLKAIVTDGKEEWSIEFNVDCITALNWNRLFAFGLRF